MSTEAPKRSSRKGIPNHPIEFRRQLAKAACEPDVSVARLAMEHGLNPNLLFKWRRALRAGDYDPVGLLPVTVEAPVPEIERPTAAATSVIGAAAVGAIEINVGNTRVHIEGSPNEATLLLVLRMLRGTSESAA